MSKLTIGDHAPDFELLNQDGEPVTLGQFKGKKNVVLFFYPKDETPGCIKEVCSFRDSYEQFQELGAEVIGISSDSVDSHKLFALNRRLPFHLLSDPKGKARKLYTVSTGALGISLLAGRETFVIGKQGIIRHRFASMFQIDQHINDALKVVKELMDAGKDLHSPSN
ncbi:MAG: peroxiredoxin [Bacteroidota bacterium]